MPHENEVSPGANDEVFPLETPLSPELSAKLKAKKFSKRKIGKVKVNTLLLLLACIIYFYWDIFYFDFAEAISSWNVCN